MNQSAGAQTFGLLTFLIKQKGKNGKLLVRWFLPPRPSGTPPKTVAH